MDLFAITSRDIERYRPPRNMVDPRTAYHALVELEFSRSGITEDVATIFLTNRECAYRCLMCDLWKNTLETDTPRGDIPTQIREALRQLPKATQLKLYNSGNFFDRRAIPVEDHGEIAALCSPYATVIVENHPRMCGPICLEFRDRLPNSNLEIALGLETAHEPTLRMLNKQMTIDDFRRAAEFLRGERIFVRTFLLLRPPGMSEAEGIDWALHSLEFAFDCGSDVCAVIPTRVGNGIMEQLSAEGQFAEPKLRSLETVLETALAWNRGRVFADLWDVERFADCQACAAARIERLRTMNLTQCIPPRIHCECDDR